MEGCTEKHSTKSKPVVSGIFAALKFEWIFAKYVCPQDIMCDSSRFLPGRRAGNPNFLHMQMDVEVTF